MPPRQRTIDVLICAQCGVEFPYKQSGRKANRFCGWDCLQASRTPEGRFWAKVDKNSPIPDACPELGPCWCWIGSLFTDSGYGQFWLEGTNRRAHVVSYEWAHGAIPADTDADQVQHLCNVRHCVNPAHLVLGTPSENTQYASQSGRLASGDRHWTHQDGIVVKGLRGASNPRAKLTDADIADIRRDAAAGIPQVILAQQRGISPAAVSQIVNRQSWKHVP